MHSRRAADSGGPTCCRARDWQLPPSSAWPTPFLSTRTWRATLAAKAVSSRRSSASSRGCTSSPRPCWWAPFSIECGWMHGRVRTGTRATRPRSEEVDMREAKEGILILGGGFAGSYVARLLGAGGATIVSLENFMLYTPMLVEAASGTLEPRH